MENNWSQERATSMEKEKTTLYSVDGIRGIHIWTHNTHTHTHSEGEYTIHVCFCLSSEKKYWKHLFQVTFQKCSSSKQTGEAMSTPSEADGNKVSLQIKVQTDLVETPLWYWSFLGCDINLWVDRIHLDHLQISLEGGLGARETEGNMKLVLLPGEPSPWPGNILPPLTVSVTCAS